MFSWGELSLGNLQKDPGLGEMKWHQNIKFCLPSLRLTPICIISAFGPYSKKTMGSQKVCQTSSPLPFHLTTSSSKEISEAPQVLQKHSHVAARSGTGSAQRGSCTGLAWPRCQTLRPQCGCAGCSSGRSCSAGTCSCRSPCHGPAGTGAAGPCHQTSG